MSRYVPGQEIPRHSIFSDVSWPGTVQTMTHRWTLSGLGFPDLGHTLPRLGVSMVPWNRHPLNNPCWTNSIKRVTKLVKILNQEKNLLFQVISRCETRLPPWDWTFKVRAPLSFLGKRKFKCGIHFLRNRKLQIISFWIWVPLYYSSKHISQVKKSVSVSVCLEERCWNPSFQYNPSFSQ